MVKKKNIIEVKNSNLEDEGLSFLLLLNLIKYTDLVFLNVRPKYDDKVSVYVMFPLFWTFQRRLSQCEYRQPLCFSPLKVKSLSLWVIFSMDRN